MWSFQVQIESRLSVPFWPIQAGPKTQRHWCLVISGFILKWPCIRQVARVWNKTHKRVSLSVRLCTVVVQLCSAGQWLQFCHDEKCVATHVKRACWQKSVSKCCMRLTHYSVGGCCEYSLQVTVKHNAMMLFLQ